MYSNSQLYGSGLYIIYGQMVMPPANIISSCRACPEAVHDILQQIRRNICDILNEHDIHLVPECGDGLWYRVAYLNMTDPSQQCPPACLEEVQHHERLWKT